jgi:hypothetical protein
MSAFLDEEEKKKYWPDYIDRDYNWMDDWP